MRLEWCSFRAGPFEVDDDRGFVGENRESTADRSLSGSTASRLRSQSKVPHTRLGAVVLFFSKLSKALLRPTAVAIGNRRHHQVHIENFGLGISPSKSTILFKKSPRASLLPRWSSPQANGHSDQNLLSGTAITICRCVDGAFRHILHGYLVQFVDPFREAT